MKNLRNVRKECNLTQKQIAELLNISQQSYSDYENEKTQPDFETLIKIADALNVSIDYLLGRTDELGGVITSPLSPTVPALTDEERQLLDLFSRMDRAQKIQALGYCEGLISIKTGARYPNFKA